MICFVCGKKSISKVIGTALCRKHYDTVNVFIKRHNCEYQIPTGYFKKCKVSSCQKVSPLGKDMCATHNNMMLARGSVEKDTQEKQCYICGDKATAKGLCVKHYASLRNYGDPLRSDNWNKNRSRIKKCLICDERAVARGYCGKHYYSFRIHGDPTKAGEYFEKRRKK